MTINVRRFHIPDSEVELKAIRSQGPGGQNVNKVSSAIHLRFDINASSLPDTIKEQLCAHRDKRITRDGCIIIKAQQFRTQEQNRVDALARLHEIIAEATHIRKLRRPTKPSRAAKQRRLDGKLQKSKIKNLRRNSFDLN